MGRHGGGRHGGGGGGGHHHYHSHRRTYHRTRYGRSSGGGGEGGILQHILSFIVLIIIGSLACTIVFAVSKSNSPLSPRKLELNSQEQYLYCTNKNINLEYTSNNINIYESVNGTPQLSTEIRERTDTMSGALSDSYKYTSFFLAPGSNLTWNFYSPSSYVNVILIKGVKQMNKFISGKGTYTSEYWGDANTYTYEVFEFDEYFVIVDCSHYSTYSIEITASVTVYDTVDLTEQCNFYPESGKCTLNSDNNDEFCVLIEYSSDEENNTVNDFSTVKIVISGEGAPKEDKDINSILVIVFGVILGVSVVLLVVLLIIKNNPCDCDCNSYDSIDSNSTIFNENDDPYITKDDQSFTQQRDEVEPGDVSQPAISPSDIPTSIPAAYQAAPSYGTTNVDTSYPTAPPPQ